MAQSVHLPFYLRAMPTLQSLTPQPIADLQLCTTLAIHINDIMLQHMEKAYVLNTWVVRYCGLIDSLNHMLTLHTFL